jgi:hypothetical protein
MDVTELIQVAPRAQWQSSLASRRSLAHTATAIDSRLDE